ncbi:hypothetical protein TCAL_04688 [Tigriopus californicus]|uniref:Deoxynucleoside kinase domain-containing protein n=1 Tax=Tigriopus californicus TaxID=6832 RepID=A0A553NSQ8_TIGCA|nr:deoxynucleoside kinase-like [Tigriopus californicus]TRY68449.1 hypothetical protein TCAL_04688 [Tigriopus californicus]
MEHTRPFTVIVEGNIGSGKSTFLECFSKYPQEVEVFPEPVAKWRDVRGHNLFQLMYEDQERWSMAFQSYAQLTMLELHNQTTLAPVKIMERSIFSGRHCFIENLHEEKKMKHSEYTVLCEWFDFLQKSPMFNLKVDLIVYLKTSPEVAFKRVKQRARSEEKILPIEYLRNLHDLHEKWLHQSTDLPAELVVIEADQNLEQNPDMYAQVMEKVLAKAQAQRDARKENPRLTKLSLTRPAKTCYPSSPTKVLGEVNKIAPGQ